MKLFELKLKSVNPSTIFSELEENVFYTLVCDSPSVVYDSIDDQEVEIEKLIPTQGQIDSTSVDNSDPIIVAKRHGKLYIIDGHHRYGRDRRTKQKTISACVIDLPDQLITDLHWFEVLFKKHLKQSSSGHISIK